MTGKLKSKEEIVKDTLQVVFEVNEPFTFRPGQYFFVNLPAGRKQFSINNSPNQSNILSLATRLTGSDFKNALNGLPAGADVELGPIAGVFTLPEDQSRPLVLIAGGIGITPFMSMLSYIKEQNLPCQITLIYSNRNRQSAAFFNELQELTRLLPNFKLILTMTDDPDWEGEKRKVDADFIREYFPDVNKNLYMVVGPPAMVEAVERALLEAGVEKENIKIENFTGY